MTGILFFTRTVFKQALNHLLLAPLDLYYISNEHQFLETILLAVGITDFDYIDSENMEEYARKAGKKLNEKLNTSYVIFPIYIVSSQGESNFDRIKKFFLTIYPFINDAINEGGFQLLFPLFFEKEEVRNDSFFEFVDYCEKIDLEKVDDERYCSWVNSNFGLFKKEFKPYIASLTSQGYIPECRTPERLFEKITKEIKGQGADFNQFINEQNGASNLQR